MHAALGFKKRFRINYEGLRELWSASGQTRATFRMKRAVYRSRMTLHNSPNACPAFFGGSRTNEKICYLSMGR